MWLGNAQLVVLSYLVSPVFYQKLTHNEEGLLYHFARVIISGLSIYELKTHIFQIWFF